MYDQQGANRHCLLTSVSQSIESGQCLIDRLSELSSDLPTYLTTYLPTYLKVCGHEPCLGKGKGLVWDDAETSPMCVVV